jgi:hypothetical protein
MPLSTLLILIIQWEPEQLNYTYMLDSQAVRFNFWEGQIFHFSLASQLALGAIKHIEWALEVLSLAR